MPSQQVLYKTYPPPQRLARYVRMFWVYEINFLQPEPYIYRSVADGGAEILFHYKGPFDEINADRKTRCDRALVHAQTKKFHRFDTEGNFGIFGVYLHPPALAAIFNLPSDELSDEMVNLQTLLGAEGEELTDRIMNARTNEDRVSLLTQFLEKKLLPLQCSSHYIHDAVNHMVRAQGQINVKDMADRYCLSLRQFERKFKACSGFSPKVYSRILRFNEALNSFGRINSLTELAHDCGYYDQSHFIKDFKEFSGYDPSTYFFGNAEGTEYREV
ncbi:helix-turn-helix domain-containing protein [Fulvivirga ligni]|uniref:helix-turn-helix domain-containing protein n=1 Tax=Fulvivirga ligni TaxID=2904246 RepID=UPI001F432AAD|nr:helix-turn-helix domain-containing protein [Fulvivirga ligni]UII23841.1 helix-turn-helix domain-containing protein [Fulvivirga ligni]